MVTIDGIPVFDAVIDGDSDGMMKISLVDSPAVMSDFQKFKEGDKPQMFAVEDEEKRLVYGVIMRADFPIYRYDNKYGEYYIVYKADTIRVMAEKYIKEGRCNNVNLQHEEGSDVDGVQMVQCFIKDTARGVNPNGFDKIADGSLFGEFHVTNDDVWAEIKAGTYKGFSLEGYFGLIPDDDFAGIAAIVDYLEGKFNKISKNDKRMTKIGRMLATVRAALILAQSATTDKGVIYWGGDEDELKVGDEVFTDEEKTTPAEDGNYIREDGSTVVVKDGKVDEIKPAVAEEEPKDEEPAEPEQTNEDEPKDEEPAEPEAPKDETPDEVAELRARVDELEARVAALEGLLGIQEQMSAMQAELAELKKRPATLSAHELYKSKADAEAAPRDRRCATRKTL